ncbi:hypothetical protein C8F04DRAFT_1270670 [Mycena alexandri]|uniref:Uncharacterized protein n=1 Tax=Mycena alexandri TaxID=1745969 RepID=A0AAD6WT92_9AGAR|nr:hypothetical protein C8F04DRAFT_1270670 [Mycena alexandri]
MSGGSDAEPALAGCATVSQPQNNDGITEKKNISLDITVYVADRVVEPENEDQRRSVQATQNSSVALNRQYDLMRFGGRARTMRPPDRTNFPMAKSKLDDVASMATRSTTKRATRSNTRGSQLHPPLETSKLPTRPRDQTKKRPKKAEQAAPPPAVSDLQTPSSSVTLSPTGAQETGPDEGLPPVAPPSSATPLDPTTPDKHLPTLAQETGPDEGLLPVAPLSSATPLDPTTPDKHLHTPAQETGPDEGLPAVAPPSATPLDPTTPVKHLPTPASPFPPSPVAAITPDLGTLSDNQPPSPRKSFPSFPLCAPPAPLDAPNFFPAWGARAPAPRGAPYFFPALGVGAGAGAGALPPATALPRLDLTQFQQQKAKGYMIPSLRAKKRVVDNAMDVDNATDVQVDGGDNQVNDDHEHDDQGSLFSDLGEEGYVEVDSSRQHQYTTPDSVHDNSPTASPTHSPRGLRPRRTQGPAGNHPEHERGGSDSPNDTEDDYSQTEQAKVGPRLHARKHANAEKLAQLRTESDLDESETQEWEQSLEKLKEKGKGKGKGKGKQPVVGEEDEDADDEEESARVRKAVVAKGGRKKGGRKKSKKASVVNVESGAEDSGAEDSDAEDNDAEDSDAVGAINGRGNKAGPVSREIVQELLELKERYEADVEELAKKIHKGSNVLWRLVDTAPSQFRETSAWNMFQRWLYTPESDGGHGQKHSEDLNKQQRAELDTAAYHERLAGLDQHLWKDRTAVLKHLDWLQTWHKNLRTQVIDSMASKGPRNRIVKSAVKEGNKLSERMWKEGNVHLVGFVISTQGGSKAVMELELGGASSMEYLLANHDIQHWWSRNSYPTVEKRRDAGREFVSKFLAKDILAILAERGELTGDDATKQMQIPWTSWANYAFKNKMRMENWDDQMASANVFPKSGFVRTKFDMPQLRRVLPAMEARHGIPTTEENDSGSDDEDTLAAAQENLADEALRIVAWTEEESAMSLVEQQDLPLLTTTSGVILSHVHDAPGWTKARQEEKDRAEKAKEKAAAKPKTKAKRGTTATGASATATGASSSAPGRKRKANPPVDAAEEGAAAKKSASGVAAARRLFVHVRSDDAASVPFPLTGRSNALFPWRVCAWRGGPDRGGKSSRVFGSRAAKMAAAAEHQNWLQV